MEFNKNKRKNKQRKKRTIRDYFNNPKEDENKEPR